MALKFLNKKGWHTGSLRNIENVWKAEQKRDAEEKKLDELRKQIQEERERTEFRRLQEQAGLVPKQERLDFLYDSGLSVGRPANSEGFKELEAFPKNAAAAAPSSSASASAEKASAPGALFEEKPQSANDAWRKLHSDPLLMIRQREQEALARIKNNPVKMALILKSVDTKKDKEKKHDKKEKHKKKYDSISKHHKHSSSRQQSDSEHDIAENTISKMDKYIGTDSEEDGGRRKKSYKDFKYRDRSPSKPSRRNNSKDHNRDAEGRDYDKSRRERYHSEGQRNSSTHYRDGNGERDRSIIREASTNGSSVTELHRESRYKRKNIASKLTDEERAARLKEMQLAAELHEEQRWKRLKKADEEDAREVLHTNSVSVGKNFLESAQKSVYGAEKGGSSTIAESVRRRTHYLQGRSEASEGNAFRR